MSGYIMMDKDLEEDPRVDDLGHALYQIMGGVYRDDCDASQRQPANEPLFGVCRDAILGGLYKLWRHGDAFLGRHNRFKGASHGAARFSKITSLPLSLVSAFPPEWLKIHTDGTIELPDYGEKNRLQNRDIRRANGRERTKKWRAKKHAESNGGDASQNVTSERHERHQSVTTGTGTLPDRTIDRTGPVPEHPLASALGRLADAKTSEAHQPFKRNGHPPPPTKTPAELEADALKLAGAGMVSGDIARCLEQYGVSLQQVIGWLANAPAVAS